MIIAISAGVVINMADKPLFEYSHEPESKLSVAGRLSVGRKPSANKLAAPTDFKNRTSLAAQDNWQRSSRKSSKLSLLSAELGLDKSRTISALSIDPRRGSEAGYDSDDDEGKEIGLEERLARDRINHLHDVFVSAQGTEGLSMDEFRAAMRQVMLTESGRKMEDDELDKVSRLLHAHASCSCPLVRNRPICLKF